MLQLIKLIINSKEGIGCLHNSYILNQPVFENVGLIVSRQFFLCDLIVKLILESSLAWNDWSDSHMSIIN